MSLGSEGASFAAWAAAHIARFTPAGDRTLFAGNGPFTSTPTNDDGQPANGLYIYRINGLAAAAGGQDRQRQERDETMMHGQPFFLVEDCGDLGGGAGAALGGAFVPPARLIFTVRISRPPRGMTFTST